MDENIERKDKSNQNKIKINDKIFIKNFQAKKYDNQYLGPVAVTQVGKKGRWIKIKGFDSWINIKNIKLWRRG